MRENGLRAAAYVAVTDLHPQVADLMLSALAEAGVAAYASPAGGTRGLLLPAQFPDGPLDRLFVDRDAYDRARQVLDEHLPGARAGLGAASGEPGGAEPASAEVGRGLGVDRPGQTDRSDPTDPSTQPDPTSPVDDDAWGRIVAAFHGTAADQEASGAAGEREARASANRPNPAAGVPLRAWPEAEDVDDADDDDLLIHRARPMPPGSAGRDDDRYVPPPPPPLPTGDQTTRLAWAGVVGGPVLFLLALLLDWELASWAKLVGVAGLVLGFITLVTRMRDDTPDDPEHGAVV